MFKILIDFRKILTCKNVAIQREMNHLQKYFIKENIH